MNAANISCNFTSTLSQNKLAARERRFTGVKKLSVGNAYLACAVEGRLRLPLAISEVDRNRN